MKFFKIHPEVSCCAYKSGVLHDKDAVYPETMWPEGEALTRVARGFLVEVVEKAEVTKTKEPEKKTDEIKEPEGKKSRFK